MTLGKKGSCHASGTGLPSTQPCQGGEVIWGHIGELVALYRSGIIWGKQLCQGLRGPYFLGHGHEWWGPGVQRGADVGPGGLA